MALLIDKNVTILGNVDLTQLYLRLTISYGPGGSTLIIQSSPYASKSSYDLDAYSNSFPVLGISESGPYIIDYDRVANGSDILTYAHNEVKTILSTDIMKDIPVLDPSTGEPTYDPSTGDPITEEVVDIPRFAEDSSISLVDI